MKQFFQNFRGKPETLCDELKSADKKVENFKTATHILSKKLGTGNSTGMPLGSEKKLTKEKRLKKIPEHTLGVSLKGLDKFEEGLLKDVLLHCGEVEMDLAEAIDARDTNIEDLVSEKLNNIVEKDIPNISKAKKQFTRLCSEKESASSRYNLLNNNRNIQDKTTQEQQKISQACDEFEEAELKADQARDAFASEMFTLLSKEIDFSETVLQYVKLQKNYHENALNILTNMVPQIEQRISDCKIRPIFGLALEEHLRITGRTIAYPLELCVCLLHELALNEEGLLRIAAGSSRMKRMKLSLDSGMFILPMPQVYKDVHVIGSILKSYLRELPEPLFTFNLYDSFIAAIINNSTESNRLNALWDVIHRLPSSNFNNLNYLIKFLSVLTKNHAVNKMTPSNIAIVMAPNLMWIKNDDSGLGFNMNNATTVNCIIELLVKHADWFFKKDIEFFITIKKENLLREPEVKGNNQPHNDQTNGESPMSKSMYENPSSVDHLQSSTKFNTLHASNKQSHSRSNSHDASLILTDNGMKRTQSNNSVSQDSPKSANRKIKPSAPVPPDSREKKDSPKTDVITQSKDVKCNSNKTEFEKRPPHPTKSIEVQTINRSTYKNKHIGIDKNRLCSSKESLTDFPPKERRNSCDSELGSRSKDGMSQTHISISSMSTQHEPVSKIINTDTCQNPNNCVNTKSNLGASKQFTQTVSDLSSNQFTKPISTAVPKSATKQDSSTLTETEQVAVQMRSKPITDVAKSVPVVGVKPAIPERPASIRPSSHRNSLQKNPPAETSTDSTELSQNGNLSDNITLERAQVYNTVDKQQVVFTQTTNTHVSEAAPSNSDDGNKLSLHRTQSTGTQNTDVTPSIDQQISTSQMRKSNNSEADTLLTSRPLHKPPPCVRPQGPAPPPPVPRASDERESTDL